jgi:hypothetical protein
MEMVAYKFRSPQCEKWKGRRGRGSQSSCPIEALTRPCLAVPCLALPANNHTRMQPIEGFNGAE